MHNLKTSETKFHFNSDFSGGVIVDISCLRVVSKKDDPVISIEIPGDDLLKLFAHYAATRKIAHIQISSLDSLLGIGEK